MGFVICWRSLACFSCRSATLLTPKACCRHLGRCLDSSARRVNLHKSEVSAAVTAIHSLFYFWSSIGEIKNTLYRSLFNDELTNSRASQLCEEREIKLGFLLLLGAQSQCKDFSVLSFPLPQPEKKQSRKYIFHRNLCCACITQRHTCHQDLPRRINKEFPILQPYLTAGWAHFRTAATKNSLYPL